MLLRLNHHNLPSYISDKLLISNERLHYSTSSTNAISILIPHPNSCVGTSTPSFSESLQGNKIAEKAIYVTSTFDASQMVHLLSLRSVSSLASRNLLSP